MRSELAEVRALALERFPHQRVTLETFFAQLDLAPGPEWMITLDRLEELLEALLAGEALR